MTTDRERFDPQVSWVRGSCSTYCITHDAGTLAIDCGQLDPSHLGAPVQHLLLTHFHRDQCAAASAWSAAGVEVIAPFAEKRFFAEADMLRASYDTYDNYTAFFPGFSALTDLQATWAQDYHQMKCSGIDVSVVPLPGHTFGSTGYLLGVGGVTYLACGDLLSSPGKLHDYARAQWSYMSFQGHVNSLESLATVRRLAPDVILPGHEAPFDYSDDAIATLESALRELYALFHGRDYEPYRPVFRRLSQRVVEVSNSMANSYIVHDGEGHGLFIDCGYTSGAPISANPHRFIDHLTPWLESEIGVREVEWFLPSHYHDDHLAGLPALQAIYGTRVSCSPELADIIEHPENYDMPCTVPHATSVDRIVARDEVFSWRGVDFRIEQFPGQTWYHHLITFDVDDRRYLSIGDNISGLCLREERDFIHSFIPKNRTPVSSYRDMPKQIRDRAPDVLLTGHGGGVDCDTDKVQRWQAWMDRWAELFEAILDQPHPDMGMDPHWVQFYPYKVRVTPGDSTMLEIRVRNHETEVRQVRLGVRASGAATVTPEAIKLTVGARQDATATVTLSTPEQPDVHAWTVVADVNWDDRPYGEIAEAIVWW